MMTTTGQTILGVPVTVDASLVVDGTLQTLNQADVKRLLDCIRWTQPPPVNGKVSLIVEAETIPY